MTEGRNTMRMSLDDLVTIWADFISGRIVMTPREANVLIREIGNMVNTEIDKRRIR